jgi:hypothetical protein
MFQTLLEVIDIDFSLKPLSIVEFIKVPTKFGDRNFLWFVDVTFKKKKGDKEELVTYKFTVTDPPQLSYIYNLLDGFFIYGQPPVILTELTQEAVKETMNYIVQCDPDGDLKFLQTHGEEVKIDISH